MNDLTTWAYKHAEQSVFVVFFCCFASMALYELKNRLSDLPSNRLSRWPANILLTALFVVMAGLIPITLLVAAEWAGDQEIGLFNALDLSPWVALVVGFLARSFISYATHFAMHRIPPLWRIHRIHHLDTQLDISTTVRFHPLEPIATLPFSLLGVVSLGISPLAVLLYEIFDAAITPLTHANVKWPDRLERHIRKILVTPQLHRVHHSVIEEDFNCNFGATFSIWDRLFGTLKVKDLDALRQQPVGVVGFQEARTNNLLWLLTSPLLKSPDHHSIDSKEHTINAPP